MKGEQTKETKSKKSNYVSKKKFLKEDSMSTSQSSTESLPKTNFLLE